MLDKKNQIQEAGDRWLQQREQYRNDHLLDLRRREGLIEGGYDVLCQSDGRPIQLPYQTGKRKGKKWEEAARDTSFSIVESDHDGLARELQDLERDAQNLSRSEMVRFDDVPTGPEMHCDLNNEEELGRWMADHLKRRMER